MATTRKNSSASKRSVRRTKPAKPPKTGARARLQRPDKRLAGLVESWGGFEQLVADLHSHTDVTVERNVELPAKEGRTYKIDVVIRSKQGLHRMLTIIECKWWKDRVGRDRITHLKHVREQVGANKAVCFTTRGFQAGAKTAARMHDIDLFLVKEMSDPDWGRPGKIIQLYLQIYQAAVSPLLFPKALYFAPSAVSAAQKGGLHVREDEGLELRPISGSPSFKVIDLYKELRQDAYRRVVAQAQVMRNGLPGVHYVSVRYDSQDLKDGACAITLAGRTAHVSAFSCDIVFEVRQRDVQIDRGAKLDFALVIEDYLVGDRYAASRRLGQSLPDMIKLEPSAPTKPGEEAVVNGSITALLVDGFLDYARVRASMIAQKPDAQLLPTT